MSPLQNKIYQFIKDYLSKHGHSPTLLEIAKGVGISPQSKGLVSRYVHKLVKLGQLVFDSKGYRNISLPLAPQFQLTIEGKIAAGSPIELVREHNILDLTTIFGEEDTYVLVIEGDYLAGQGILGGDKLICKRQSEVKEGTLVLAKMDQNHTAVKQISYLDEQVIKFKADTSAFNPLSYSRERVAIQAVVVGVLRILN